MELFNGGTMARADVPLLSESAFREEIIACCGDDARLANLFGAPDADGSIRLFAVLAFDDDAVVHVVSMKVVTEDPRYESLTKDLPAAHLFEREIAEQWAVIPQGHPWLKPLRRHANYRGVPDVFPDAACGYPFYAVEGEEVHEVCVGPVHAGIIEPGHFRFQCHGEEILHLETQMGYQHRGIEPMMTGHDLRRSVLLSESVAGDTSIGHSTAFCEIVESLSGCMIPPRAQAIRAVALELERLANHVGDLGAMSMDAGFMPASSYFGRMRGDYLNLLLTLSGNRFGKGLNRPGGVLCDIDAAMADDFCRKLKKYQHEFDDVSDLLFTRSSVLARFEDTGVLTTTLAKELGLVGPASRACQLERDVRINYPSGLWQYHHIPISLAATGDVFARAFVRRQEVTRSLEFLLKVLPTLPKGGIFAKPDALRPDALGVSMVEGWRGEIMHVGITDAAGGFARYKIKDPSFHNLAGLCMAVRNQDISDFPLCNKSFNLSYCGHDL
jgi:Ni,Fe-hydrogenase III large subunit